MSRLVGLTMLLIALIAPATRADVTYVEENQEQGVVQVYRLTVSPAAEPQPTFKHRLTIQPDKTIAGNAITHYLRAYGENGVTGPLKNASDKYGSEFNDWYSPKVATMELPLEKLRDVAAMFDSLIDNHIARATLCRECEWGLAEEDLSGEELYGFLLPSVQQTRTISRMLALRTRLDIAEGRFDDAVKHLRMNYQLARNVSRMKFLVSVLVGIAEVGIAHEGMIQLIGAPNSPNMYWALAELPVPMIDLRDAMRLELADASRVVPLLEGVETAEHSVEEWSRLLDQTVKSFASISELAYGAPSDEREYSTVGLSLIAYPAAKRRLIEQGMDKEQVEAMAVGQVLLINAAQEYQRYANQIEKALYVPIRQRKQFEDEVEQQLSFVATMLEPGAILAGMFLPAVIQVSWAQERIEWQRRALQNIEAIRMHVAKTGKLPASLEEITVVPVPRNPMTQETYRYRLEGDKAILELPFSDGFPGFAQRFEIQVAK